MPDLINICTKCDKQFKIRDDFLKHLTEKHGVQKDKYWGIANEF